MQVNSITGTQLRAARGALNWSVRKLSEATGIGSATIVRYEEVEGVPISRKDNIQRIIATLESLGIEFIGAPDDRPGIRIHSIKKPSPSP